MLLIPGRQWNDAEKIKKKANAKQRITTKYSFPSQRPSALNKKAQSQKRQEQKKKQQQSQNESDPSSQSTSALTQQQETTTTPATPVASLTLKTYSPATGICLKYRTNKAAEVGRLITSLGKLAAGADVAGLGLSSAAPAAGAGGDVEMTDAPPASEDAAAAGKADTGAKGGKGKKKGGKGKR